MNYICICMNMWDTVRSICIYICICGITYDLCIWSIYIYIYGYVGQRMIYVYDLYIYICMHMWDDVWSQHVTWDNAALSFMSYVRSIYIYIWICILSHMYILCQKQCVRLYVISHMTWMITQIWWDHVFIHICIHYINMYIWDNVWYIHMG